MKHLSRHVKTICLIGQGAATCKYLLIGENGFECAKHEGYAPSIDRQWAHDSTKVAQGDNCDGKPQEELNS